MRETRLFEDAPITLGRFRCRANHPRFENTGPAQGFLIVFPREAVEIEQAGRTPVVANPNVLMFYNLNQEYRRRKISEWGDRCEFLGVKRELLLECIRRYEPAVDDRPDQPFPFASRPISNRIYLQQRALNIAASRLNPEQDQLIWEEESLKLLDNVLRESMGLRAESDSKSTTSHLDLVFDAQCYLSANYCRSLSLEQIANAIDSSPYHLCRVFRRVTGISIHKFTTNLRMRSALERVQQGADLTMVALDLGYSSHSHFTSVFRRTFGVTPKAWREQH